MTRRSRVVVLFIAFLPTVVLAGHEKGNGGGAWVCEDTQNNLRWVELADLDVGRELGFNIPVGSHGSEEEWMAKVHGKLRELDPSSDREFEIEVNRIKKAVSFTDSSVIGFVRDSILPPAWPKSFTCAGGFPQYQLVARYSEYGTLYVDRRLFAALDPMNRAALWTHEAMYAICRKRFGDTMVDRARLLTAVLLSPESLGRYRSLFLRAP
jgi:hypothetical protein